MFTPRCNRSAPHHLLSQETFSIHHVPHHPTDLPLGSSPICPHAVPCFDSHPTRTCPEQEPRSLVNKLVRIPLSYPRFRSLTQSRLQGNTESTITSHEKNVWRAQAQYYAAITFNQIVLSTTAADRAAARELMDAFPRGCWQARA
jgi:hypothetical protein